jgi:hypothetical protein
VDVAQFGVNHVKTLCLDVLFLCVMFLMHMMFIVTMQMMINV